MAIEKLNITPLHQAILDEFGTITWAAKRLGFNKKSIYQWLKAGKVLSRARKRIIDKGYCPDTFKHLPTHP